MGLFCRKKKKSIVSSKVKEGFSGWLKCTHCHELIHQNELEKNLHCCPKCDWHFLLSVEERVCLLVDKGSFEELFMDIVPGDPLDFYDSQSYKSRIKKAKAKSGRDDAILTGKAFIDSKPYSLAILDFKFMGGSMGSVVGEKLTKLIEYSIEHMLPLVVVSSSGGARMQEGMFSLMQMAKTSGALCLLHKKKIPFISIVTNPTTGGVTASFASLGDIILAEPHALVCFAGPRVIEQLLKKPLPKNAQHAESLFKHGLIDAIIPRKELRKKLSQLISFMQK